jgi:hypothetical protein
VSLTDQIKRLAERVVEARLEWFPCQVRFRNVTFTANCSGFRNSKKLQEVGFVFSHDAIARLPFTAVPFDQPPENGKELIVFVPGSGGAGQKARISEVRPHANNPEWRVGLTRI